MRRQKKWLREEVVQSLKYLYDIYNTAPSSPSHYRYLVALEQHLNPSQPLPLIQVIHNFWPNIREAWSACSIRAARSLTSLKLDFKFTVSTDQQLRTIYSRHTRRLDRLEQLKPLSATTNIPIPALALRAAQLDLDKRSHLNWTKPELVILYSHRHLSKQKISNALKAQGYERSHQAMKIIKARSELLNSDKPSHYTLTPLSNLIGLDSHCLALWCKRGYLPFERKGTVRTKQQGGDSYLIKRTDLATFFRAHPEMIDFRKINQQWFIELLRETDPLLNQTENE